MIYELTEMAAAIPATGDTFPATPLIIVGVLAVAAAGISAFLAEKKKKDDDDE